MRKLLERLREWNKWRKLAAAERAVWQYGYAIYNREYVDDALNRAVGLACLVQRSGHYHARKSVQDAAENIADKLSVSRARLFGHDRLNPEHVGSIVARALARIFSGGRGTLSF